MKKLKIFLCFEIVLNAFWWHKIFDKAFNLKIVFITSYNFEKSCQLIQTF